MSQRWNYAIFSIIIMSWFSNAQLFTAAIAKIKSLCDTLCDNRDLHLINVFLAAVDMICDYDFKKQRKRLTAWHASHKSLTSWLVPLGKETRWMTVDCLEVNCVCPQPKKFAADRNSIHTCEVATRGMKYLLNFA